MLAQAYDQRIPLSSAVMQGRPLFLSIVAAVALSIMISNDLIMPWLLQGRSVARDASPGGMTPLILVVRRFAIALLVALGLAR